MQRSRRADLLQPFLVFLLFFGILGLAPGASAFNPVARINTASVNSTGCVSTRTDKLGNHLPTALSAQKIDEDETIDTNDGGNFVEAEIAKRLKSRQILPTVGLISLSSLSVAAKLGVLGTYTDAWIAQDVGAALLTGTLGYVFVKGCTWMANKGYLNPRDSRKIIHTLSAPFFILFWPLFSPADGARFFAAAVSFVNIVRLYIAGTGGDKSLAYAVSRSGDENEALGGPFLYVCILFGSIILFWRDSPVGIVSLSAMAAGDGLADLFGRRYGKNNKWPFNQDKSIAGTVAFWAGATICASGLLASSSVELSSSLLPGNPQIILAAIMLVTALLEVIPGPFDDNWVVPLSAALFAFVAFS